MDKYIKSPLNYVGGKYKILNQIIPMFPEKIGTFVDLFCGGLNVGINVTANNIVGNDIIPYITEIYSAFQAMEIDKILQEIKFRINKYGLTKTNSEGYNSLRNDYNKNKNPIDLFVLVCFSFNHQIRYNNKHEFNMPFGKNRSAYNSSIENNLIAFVEALHNKNIVFTNYNFMNFPFDELDVNSFVYCDPPYSLTTAVYNDGWSLESDKKLYGILDELDNRGIKFMLSSVVEVGNNKNQLLIDWSKNYKTFHIDSTYKNSNYHKIDKSGSEKEVVIINY